MSWQNKLFGIAATEKHMVFLVERCGWYPGMARNLAKNKGIDESRPGEGRDRALRWQAYFEARAAAGKPVDNPGGFMQAYGAVANGLWTGRCEPPGIVETERGFDLGKTGREWDDLLKGAKTREQFLAVAKQARKENTEQSRVALRVAEHRAETCGSSKRAKKMQRANISVNDLGKGK